MLVLSCKKETLSLALLIACSCPTMEGSGTPTGLWGSCYGVFTSWSQALVLSTLVYLYFVDLQNSLLLKVLSHPYV